MSSRTRTVFGVAGVMCASLLAGCATHNPSAALEGAVTETTVLRTGDLVALVQDVTLLNQRLIEEADGATSRTGAVLESVLREAALDPRIVVSAIGEDGGVKALYHSGQATTERAADHIGYVQINRDGASVCLRLSENGEKSPTNSSDPVLNGPYNEYVAPLDGANGPGWAIVRYVQHNAQDVPGSGSFNGCDGVPSLHWNEDGFHSGATVTNW